MEPEQQSAVAMSNEPDVDLHPMSIRRKNQIYNNNNNNNSNTHSSSSSSQITNQSELLDEDDGLTRSVSASSRSSAESSPPLTPLDPTAKASFSSPVKQRQNHHQPLVIKPARIISKNHRLQAISTNNDELTIDIQAQQRPRPPSTIKTNQILSNNLPLTIIDLEIDNNNQPTTNGSELLQPSPASPPWSPLNPSFSYRHSVFLNSAKTRPSSLDFQTQSITPISSSSSSSSTYPPAPQSPTLDSLIDKINSDHHQGQTNVSVSYRDLLPRLFLLLGCLVGSLVMIGFALMTLPSLHLPTSLQVINSQIVQLRSYADASSSNFLHLTGVLSLIYIWKQAFSIPGSVLMNVLLGAIYGTWTSTILSCFLTALGSTCAYQLSRLSRPLIKKLIPKVLTVVEAQLDRFRSDLSSNDYEPVQSLAPRDEESDLNPITSMRTTASANRYDSGELWSYLLIARLLPIVPYSGLNMASGVLELPLSPFFWTLVLGSLPYNFITTQVGEVLSETANKYLEHKKRLGKGFMEPTSYSGEDYTTVKIFDSKMVMKMMILSMMMMVPMIFKNQIKRIVLSMIGMSKRVRVRIAKMFR